MAQTSSLGGSSSPIGLSAWVLIKQSGGDAVLNTDQQSKANPQALLSLAQYKVPKSVFIAKPMPSSLRRHFPTWLYPHFSSFAAVLGQALCLEVALSAAGWGWEMQQFSLLSCCYDCNEPSGFMVCPRSDRNKIRWHLQTIYKAKSWRKELMKGSLSQSDVLVSNFPLKKQPPRCDNPSHCCLAYGGGLAGACWDLDSFLLARESWDWKSLDSAYVFWGVRCS